MVDIAPEVGFTSNTTRLLTGSIGALESALQAEHLIEDLAEFHRKWEELAKVETQK